jgi:arabinose-5-phosphate isomerase
MSKFPALDDDERLLGAMSRTLELEIKGLAALQSTFNPSVLEAVRCIATIEGRVILAGVGKSGHVARKIAATLASTGTPAQYVHPSEASHGDLGMIMPEDAVLALSNSGETKELSDLINYCRRFSVPLIAMTSGPDSSLAARADIVLLTPKAEEACGETRAPTTSTTMAMAFGDALAVALIEARGFTAKDFARFHPGGALGSAFLRAKDLMHAGDVMPLVEESTPMSQALIVMSEKSFGCVGVLGARGTLSGVITDGDLRRNMSSDLLERSAGNVMTLGATTVRADLLASDALRMMTSGQRKITQLFVCDPHGRPEGLLHIHDLLRVGVS